jgi:hypothetical protein
MLSSIRRRSGGGEWHDAEYAVPIVRTVCHLGGARPGFLCPALGRGLRMPILYRSPAGTVTDLAP